MVYKDNLNAAHARIHSLEMENSKLKKQKKPKTPKEKKVKCTTCGGWFHRTGKALTNLVIATLVWGAVAAGAYPLYMLIFHREIKDCYIEYSSSRNRHELLRTVEWGMDRDMGEYNTAQAAIEDAKTLNCPLSQQ